MLRLDVQKIKRIMAKQDMSVYDLARTADVTTAWIYDIFKRRPIKQADLFAKCLKVDPKDLIVND